MPRLSPAVLALSLMAAVAIAPAEAAQRAFVSSSGNDANSASGCFLAAPCRSFESAQSVVSDGGEIVALDAAGYGPITITKNVTITANPGFYAGIAVASGNGITIATANVNVVLRGLNINGGGGTYGVNMTNGARLSIENCVISNFSVSNGSGVYVNTAAKVRIIDTLVRDNFNGILLDGGATADISNTKVFGSAIAGIYVYGSTASTTTTAAISDTVTSGNFVGIYAYAPTPSAIARASVTRSTSANNAYGIISDAGAGTQTVIAGNNLFTGNGVGLYQNGSATLKSLGNNIVDQSSSSNTSGTITTVSGL